MLIKDLILTIFLIVLVKVRVKKLGLKKKFIMVKIFLRIASRKFLTRMKTEKKVTKFQAFFIHYRNIAEFGLATSCLMSFTFKALSELVLFIKGYKVSYPSFLIILVFLSCLVISFSDLIMISLSKKYSKILKGMVEFESKTHKKLVN